VAQMQAKLQRWPEALANQKKALAIAEALLRADPSNLQAMQDLSTRHAQIGEVLLGMGDKRAALASYQRSLDLDTQVAARDPTNATAAQYVGESHVNVGGMLGDLGQAEAARDHYRRAVAAVEPFLQRDPGNADLRAVLDGARKGLGEPATAAVAAAAKTGG